MSINQKKKFFCIWKHAVIGMVIAVLAGGIFLNDSTLAGQKEENEKITAIQKGKSHRSKNISEANITGVTTKNYTGKPVTLPKLKVKLGKKTLRKGKDYQVSYKHNKKQGLASVTIQGKGKYTGKITKKFQITVIAGKSYTVDKMKYQVKDVGENGVGTVALAGSSYGRSSKKLTRLKIRDYVDIGGRKYRVAAVGKRAFKRYRNIQQVVIGNCVEEIGREAFANCRKLVRVNVKTHRLKSVGKHAFYKAHKDVRIRIPVSKAKEYGRLFGISK